MKNPTVASRYWGSGAAHLSPAGPVYPRSPRSTSRGECPLKNEKQQEAALQWLSEADRNTTEKAAESCPNYRAGISKARRKRA